VISSTMGSFSAFTFPLLKIAVAISPSLETCRKLKIASFKAQLKVIR